MSMYVCTVFKLYERAVIAIEGVRKRTAEIAAGAIDHRDDQPVIAEGTAFPRKEPIPESESERG